VPLAPPAGERLPRRATLRKSADYQSCYRAGRRRHGPLLTLHIQPNPIGAPRLGITASRRVGDAVVRTRLKRWTRECFRRSPCRAGLPAVDLVVHLKPEAGRASFAAFAAEIEARLSELARRPS
jgi:ribonuclease P protein component